MLPCQELSPFQFRGARAPPRVAVGALAECFRSFNRKWRSCQEVVGGGADHHTRGACAPQNKAVPSLDEYLEALTTRERTAGTLASFLTITTRATCKFRFKKTPAFAEKRGVRSKKITLFCVIFHLFVVFSFATRCRPATSASRNPPEKIIPKNLP